MPDLPTFTVSNDQAQRILAAYGSVENYRLWLKEQIRDYVLGSEKSAMLAEFDAEVRAKQEDIDTALDI